MNLETFKIGMIGDAEVGKTTLAQIYITNGLYPREYHMVS